MKILFMHPNMPGQYKHLCRIYGQDPNHTVVFVTKNNTAHIKGVHKVVYRPRREPSPHTHRYLLNAERGVLQGQEAWRACKKLRDEEGFVPDVICTHPGWGDALYVKDVWPNTPVLGYFEFFYLSHGADVGFDATDPISADDLARVRTKNVINLLNLDIMDWGLSPTHWQQSLHPEAYRSRISVLHDGIDTTVAKPDPDAVFSVKNTKQFKKGDRVVTYIARNFEPYRGFPTFMRAAERMLKEDKDLHIIAVGADEVSYGKQAPDGKTYRQIMMEEVKPDMSRLHFVGTVPYGDLMKLFQISAAHIYLTFPFVLSWSALESMACGACVIMSDTQPVQEVIRDGKNGFLADFFSPEDVAKKVLYAVNHPKEMEPIRKAAREYVIQRYEISRLLPLHMQLVEDVARKQFPPPAHEKINALYKE